MYESNEIIRYPKESYNTAKKDAQGIPHRLVVSDEFGTYTEKDCLDDFRKAPLQDASFSRFVFTIIEGNREKGCKTVLANLPTSEIETIKQKMNLCKWKIMENIFDGTKPTDNVAYTYVFSTGRFKGKTAAEIINEDDGENRLIQQKNYLKDNLAKYPNNQKGIDAIDAALTLKKNGGVDTKMIKNNTIIVHQGVSKYLAKKTIKNPNYKNPSTDKGELTFIYSIQIECSPSANSPFDVKIMNCYAPVYEKEDGSSRISLKDSIKLDGKTSGREILQFSFTEKDFSDMINKLASDWECYHNIVFKRQYALADKHSRLSKEASLNERNNHLENNNNISPYRINKSA
ncbi:hypothetical protein [Butyrivibrio fibrisolvens]|uniref:hypothetical protein n=1 Tax=Butyrivibrio fibrisolvens TaxID=831 RepID=UPI0003B59D52|nr:hypothetical protein [Butyrivibrio fibrisolvens]